MKKVDSTMLELNLRVNTIVYRYPAVAVAVAVATGATIAFGSAVTSALLTYSKVLQYVDRVLDKVILHPPILIFLVVWMYYFGKFSFLLI